MKLIGIEDLLRWTYGQEMPKAEALRRAEFRDWAERPAPPSASSAWNMVAEVALLGTMVDRTGAAPSSQYQPPEGASADALLVHDLVLDLADTTLTMPEGFEALGDIEGLQPQERADAHGNGWDLTTAKGDRLMALVMRRAMVGDRPPWHDHGQISRRPVLGPNGKDRWFRIRNASEPGRPATPLEVEGYDMRNHRPFRGAYRKFYLDPCPSLLVAERIEYQAWVLALGFIYDALRDEALLTDHVLTDAMPPLWPWDGDADRSAPRILRSRLSTGSREPMQPA